MSGPAVRAIALAQIHSVCEAISIPVVGMGGVQTGADARDLIRAGATLVAVGTESFRDPAAGARIVAELERERQTSRIRSAAERCRGPAIHVAEPKFTRRIKGPVKAPYSRN